MPFFRTKPPIDRDEYDWIVACFAWLRTVLDDAHIRPELVLPNHPDLLAAKTGPDMFEAVRRLAGMEQWDCRLEKVDVRSGDDAKFLVPEGGAACGTFSIENGQALIRYSSAMLSDPDALAATFAHELCHFLLAGAGDPPGGPDLLEHSTDCAAAYLGFGVLLANSSRSFEQWSDGQWQGWQSSTQGYLSEASLVTATAMFAALHGHDADDAAPHLKSHLRKDMTKARKAIAQDYPHLSQALGDIDLAEWAYS